MFKKIVMTSMLLASAISAQAAGSAPFGVTGTITPAACDVTLTGGIINLGLISTVYVRSLPLVQGGTAYQTPWTAVPFNIVCSAATNVYVSFSDNNPGKTFSAVNPGIRFGVVDGAGTTSIGDYQAAFHDMVLDNTPVAQYLIAQNGTSAWSTVGGAGGGTAAFANPGAKNGFAKLAGATTPDSLTTLSGILSFNVNLSSNYIQSATNSITPNGSGTMTLVYL